MIRERYLQRWIFIVLCCWHSKTKWNSIVDYTSAEIHGCWWSFLVLIDWSLSLRVHHLEPCFRLLKCIFGNHKLTLMYLIRGISVKHKMIHNDAHDPNLSAEERVRRKKYVSKILEVCTQNKEKSHRSYVHLESINSLLIVKNGYMPFLFILIV